MKTYYVSKPLVGIVAAVCMGIVAGQAKAAEVYVDDPSTLIPPVVMQPSYTAANAPDELSRAILAHALTRFDQGGKAAKKAGKGGLPWAVHHNFAQIIEQNFAQLSSAQAGQVIDSISSDVNGAGLTDLATFYNQATLDAGHKPRLLDVLSRRLDAGRMALVTAAFAAAPAGVKHAPGGQGYWLDYSPSEIYLDLRTMPKGALSPASALLETGTYVGWELYMAAYAGWTAGSLMAPVIEKYAPNLYNDIGKYLYNAVNYITQDGTHLVDIGVDQQAYGMWYVRSNWGVPVSYDGLVEKSGGDYQSGWGWGYNYNTDMGGTGGSGGGCWPYSCDLF